MPFKYFERQIDFGIEFGRQGVAPAIPTAIVVGIITSERYHLHTFL